MTDTTDLRRLLDDLTMADDVRLPGPWHATESGDKAMYGWWLDNEQGDSSFPDPADVALMVNALPGLLDRLAALERVAEKATDRGESLSSCREEADRAWAIVDLDLKRDRRGDLRAHRRPGTPTGSRWRCLSVWHWRARQESSPQVTRAAR